MTDQVLSPAAAARGRRLGAAAAIATSILFAASVMMARLVYDSGGSAVTVLAARYLAAAVLFYFWLLRTPGGPWLPWRDALPALGIGLLASSYAYGYIGSVQYIPVSLAVLVFYLNPLLVGLLAWLIDRRPLTPRLLVALVVGLFGVALALNVSFAGLDWRGVALAFWGALGVALTVVFSQRLLRRVGSLKLAFHISLAGTLAFLLIGFLGSGFDLPHGSTGWLALSGSPFGFAIGTACFYWAISLIGGLKTSTIMNAEPVLTVLAAVLVLQEPFAPIQIAGALLVGVAIFLISLPERRPAAASPATERPAAR